MRHTYLWVPILLLCLPCLVSLQRLIDQFAWQVDEVVDFEENGADMLRNSAKKESAGSSTADEMFRNDNRARVSFSGGGCGCKTPWHSWSLFSGGLVRS